MNHTFLIRIKDRPNWICSVLEIYNKLNYKGTILLADDSNDLNFNTLSSFLFNSKQHFKFNIIHKRYYLYADNSIRSQREGNTAKYALRDIKTKYFTYGTDDDIILPNFIKRGIKFLELNNNYSAVTGTELIREVSLINNQITEKIFIKYWRGYEESDPLDRITKYFIFPSLILFGVIRTESAINTINIADSAYDNYKFIYNENLRGIKSIDAEIPFALITLIYGKVKSKPSILMNIRHKWISKTRTESAWLFKKDQIDSDIQGQIIEILEKSFCKSLTIFIEQIIYLLKIYGSKYDNFTIRDVLYKSIWHILKRFNGRPLHESNISISAELKLTDKVNNNILVKILDKTKLYFMQLIYIYYSLHSREIFVTTISQKYNRFIANINYFKMLIESRSTLNEFDIKLKKLLLEDV